MIIYSSPVQTHFHIYLLHTHLNRNSNLVKFARTQRFDVLFTFNYVYCECNVTYSIFCDFTFYFIAYKFIFIELVTDTDPSVKKACTILSPSGLIASSGIRRKSSRLKYKNCQTVSCKILLMFV